jgi:hypothetical protein
MAAHRSRAYGRQESSATEQGYCSMYSRNHDPTTQKSISRARRLKRPGDSGRLLAHTPGMIDRESGELHDAHHHRRFTVIGSSYDIHEPDLTLDCPNSTDQCCLENCQRRAARAVVCFCDHSAQLRGECTHADPLKCHEYNFMNFMKFRLAAHAACYYHGSVDIPNAP